MKFPFDTFHSYWWARTFLTRCREELRGKRPHPRSIEDRIRRTALALYAEKSRDVIDPRSRTILASCCVVLEAYRECRASMTREESFELVRTALGRTLRSPIRVIARLWLGLAPRPLAWIQGGWLKRQAQRGMGPSMEFEQVDTAESAELIIRRCAYHQFFSDHGEPDLTRVFCAWDRNWMDLVDNSGRGLRTERRSTISTGGGECSFRITRDQQSLAKASDDIILMRIGTRSKE